MFAPEYTPPRRRKEVSSEDFLKKIVKSNQSKKLGSNWNQEAQAAHGLAISGDAVVSKR